MTSPQLISSTQVYTLTIKPYYNNQANNQYYTHIIEINKEPRGPLKQLVKKLNRPKLSPFNSNTYSNNPCDNTSACIYAITDIAHPTELMCISKISDLYQFILQNSEIYTIDDKLAKMLYKANIPNNQNRILFNIIETI
jgi:hypothetical protein